MKSRIPLVASLVLVASCLSPSPPNGAVQCSPSRNCPSGYTCAADNRCYKPDALPDLAVAAPDMRTDDLGTVGDGGPSGPDLAPTPAHLTIDMTTRDYGTIVQGSMSAATRFTIRNDGGSSTGSLMVVLGGANASSFAKTSDNCNTVSLLPQGSCTIDIKLQPVAPTTGAVAATLTVSATPGGSVEVSLSGNAVAPGALTLMPAMEDFGRLETNQTSAARQFTVKNTGGAATDVPMVRFTGTDASHFTFTTTCNASLAANATCTVDVKFAPKRADAISAQLEVSATPVGGTATAGVSGFGTLPNGTASTNANLCTSMVLADGVCCNVACTGPCKSCATGTCSPKPTTTQCNQTCSNATTQTNFFCNASGDCSTSGTNVTCTAYVCATNACKTSCTTNADCQTGAGYSCSNGKCVLPESDCLDGMDNNGDGLADCADPSCNAQVTCTPAVTVGNEIGILTMSSCPSEFPVSLSLHSGLNAPTTCTGCGCTPDAVCTFDLDFDYTTSTCANATGAGTISYSTKNGGVCQYFGAATTTKAFRLRNGRASSSTCAGTGSASPTPASWTVNKNFCGGSRSSNTCGANQVCVPKPATGNLCVRIPMPSAACPAGYVAGSSETLYSGFSDTRTCAPCGCAVTGTNCSPSSGLIFFASGSTQSVCPAVGDSNYTAAARADAIGGCGNMEGCIFSPCTSPLFASPLRFGAISYMQGLSATCEGRSNVNGGAASPTGGTTVCCR
jgi:hypothetical protein